jgi:hypothetical protein
VKADTPAKAKKDFRLEHHPEFLQRVAEARADLAAGRGIPFRTARRRRPRKKADD